MDQKQVFYLPAAEKMAIVLSPTAFKGSLDAIAILLSLH